MSEQDKINDFDLEPVVYCSKCYSLNIVYEDTIGSDCCRDCGCSDTQTSSVEEWDNLYTKKYGHHLIEKKVDIRQHPIFLLSPEKLKTKLYNTPAWRAICKKLYPKFPIGFSRIDSILLLFDRLYHDNRLDDLRIELINREK